MESKIHIQENLLNHIIAKLLETKSTVSVAESCTGGYVSTCFTSIRGASRYFKGGMVLYCNDVKNRFLNIPFSDIESYGVVSQNVVELMADNIRKKYKTTFGLATTGYVDYLIDNDNHSFNLNAWVSVSTMNFVKSKHVVLSKSRFENISLVSEVLLRLFRKEIV